MAIWNGKTCHICHMSIHHGNSTQDLQLNVGSTYKYLLVHLIRNFSSLLVNIVFLPLLRNNYMFLDLANKKKNCCRDLRPLHPIDWCYMCQHIFKTNISNCTNFCQQSLYANYTINIMPLYHYILEQIANKYEKRNGSKPKRIFGVE